MVWWRRGGIDGVFYGREIKKNLNVLEIDR
jgi:hypothetical protein